MVLFQQVAASVVRADRVSKGGVLSCCGERADAALVPAGCPIVRKPGRVDLPPGPLQVVPGREIGGAIYISSSKNSNEAKSSSGAWPAINPTSCGSKSTKCSPAGIQSSPSKL